MLKIKDSVDLRELEKFGFVLGMSGWQWFDDKHKFELYIDDCNVISISILEMYKSWTDIPNVIYDLIQAGFVEKVGE